MMRGKCGCENCKYCKCYPGGYFEPDDYECVAPDLNGVDWDEDLQTRVWEDGEMWDEGAEPLCPYYQKVSDERVDMEDQ